MPAWLLALFGTIGVVNVVIAAIEQIQEFGRNAPFLVNLIADLSIEQRRCLRAINSVGRQIARTKVAQAQTRRKALVDRAA